jgi:hypothetical protein
MVNREPWQMLGLFFINLNIEGNETKNQQYTSGKLVKEEMYS